MARKDDESNCHILLGLMKKVKVVKRIYRALSPSTVLQPRVLLAASPLASALPTTSPPLSTPSASTSSTTSTTSSASAWSTATTFSLTTTLSPPSTPHSIVNHRVRTVVIESYVVNILSRNTTKDMRIFVDTILQCNLQSLVKLAKNLAKKNSINNKT
ncbi:Abscisic acid receptor PYL6 [Spatholobus suberectus]|nr:Abscisic acid receptor PYL6 [Spatholobus suberectus]